MARRERLANNAETTLSSVVVTTDTTISVSSALEFPTEGDFRIVIDNELMLVTSVSGNTFTVTRGIEGTSASNHVVATSLAQILTEEGIKRLISESADPFAFSRNPFRIQDTNGALLTVSDFTTINGTSLTTFDNADGSITMEFLAPSPTERLPMLVRTAPTAPYKITGAIRLTAISDDDVGDNGPIFGPVFRDGANNEEILFRWRPLDALASRLRANYYLAEVFSVGLQSNLKAEPGIDTVVWFEMEDDNTNIFFRYSTDGIHFIEWFTELRANTLTAAPNQVGIGLVNPDVTLHKAFGTLLAWDGE